MNNSTSATIRTLLAAGTVLLVVASCGREQAATPAPGNETDTGHTGQMELVSCPQPWDYRIVVHFSSTDPHCPTHVGPVERNAGAGVCTSGKPNCIRTETGGGASKIIWASDTEDVEFGVYFDPLVGPNHESHQGCLPATIGGGNAANIPPVKPEIEVTYKYTIATLTPPPKVPDENCPPLDPGVIVEH
jgi:hypothetical protein